MEKVEKIKKLVDQFNIEKRQISKEISYIEARRTILAQIRNNKKITGNNSFECQEQINRLGRQISDLGNESQNLQNQANVKSIALKDAISEVVFELIADKTVELKKIGNKREYEKDVYQQIERYCDTDQQIAQIEKIISLEKQEKQIKSNQYKLIGTIRKIKSNQISLVLDILNDLYADKVVYEEIKLADFVAIEEQDIITEEKCEVELVQEIIKEVSNIVIKFERSELVYKATLNNGQEVAFYPTKEKTINKKQFITNLKKDLVNYVIKAHKILDYSVIGNVDPNICRLLEHVAEEHEFNYFDLVYDYAMSFSKEEDVKSTNVPIILYNLYYIKESNLNLIERTKLIKASKDAQRKAGFDVMGYNIPLLRIEYFLKRIFGFNQIKEISGEKIS